MIAVSAPDGSFGYVLASEHPTPPQIPSAAYNAGREDEKKTVLKYLERLATKQKNGKKDLLTGIIEEIRLDIHHASV